MRLYPPLMVGHLKVTGLHHRGAVVRQGAMCMECGSIECFKVYMFGFGMVCVLERSLLGLV